MFSFRILKASLLFHLASCVAVEKSETVLSADLCDSLLSVASVLRFTLTCLGKGLLVHCARLLLYLFRMDFNPSFLGNFLELLVNDFLPLVF